MKLYRVIAIICAAAANSAWSAIMPGQMLPLPQPIKTVPTAPAPVVAPAPVTAPVVAPVLTPQIAPVAAPAIAPLVTPVATPKLAPVAVPVAVAAPVAAPTAPSSPMIMGSPIGQTVKPALIAPTLPAPGSGGVTAPSVKPVTGMVPTLTAPASKPELVNPLAPPPTPPMAPKPAADGVAKPVPMLKLERPEKLTGSNLGGAKVDMSNVKQNIDTTGLNVGAPERKGGLSDLQREQGNKTFQTEDNKKASEARNFGLIGETVIKGADADTFAGERINSQHTGDTGNFRGSTAGNAGGGTAGGGSRGGSNSGNKNSGDGTSGTSSSFKDNGPSRSSVSPDGMGGGGREGGGGGNSGGSGKTDPTIDQMLRMEGGTPTGDAAKDTAELGYAQSTSGAGYQATKNMTAEERKAYWANEKNSQGMGNDQKPREDAMDGGSGAPVGTTRAMQRQNARAAERAMSARKNKAGGNSDDQRVEQTGSGGPVRSVVGNDDKPEKAQGAGTINMDKVLEINKTVNPVRN